MYLSIRQGQYIDQYRGKLPRLNRRRVRTENFQSDFLYSLNSEVMVFWSMTSSKLAGNFNLTLYLGVHRQREVVAARQLIDWMKGHETSVVPDPDSLFTST